MQNNYLVKGFKFSGITAGIKASQKKDMTLIFSEVPAVVAGTFTTGKVVAAPVTVSQKNIRSGLCQAVIVNSGNANACTGKQGLKDAEAMVAETARLLKISKQHVLVSSTGKIGVPLPMAKISRGITLAVEALSENQFQEASEGILTTDLWAKTAGVEGKVGKTSYQIAGFAKGAGMIEPHMKLQRSGGGLHATMLAYIMTYAAIERKTLEKIFENAVNQTFNRISVDGDMSTNDTALILANGVAQNKVIKSGTKEAKAFEKNLITVLDQLARLMVKDGEGATKCVRIEVKGAKNDNEAEKMAYTIANSYLVRTSFFGQDPNWGRIMGAIGRAGTALKAEKVSIFYDKVCVAKNGMSTGDQADAAAKQVMQAPAFTVTVDCRLGKGQCAVYSSDLTLDYVKLNSCYRT
ncbi:MAG: bifunctional glutamate N-acetyltransferase/amino-acid acetyltransferase ArgJ [Deltaproteobacteria bacterium]|nr:MAG: bifunctional glutamate N-acetyltransferase/amino-acid acetyltransferase ArgJ [Deltaproteobacteria bacterium]